MKKIIGIIGGVGPYAGLDLNKKVFDNTKITGKDQDYLDVILVSRASDITDRSMFLKNQITENPAEGLFRSALKLESMNAKVIAIACNTAHSPKIYDRVCELMHLAGCRTKLLHIVEETHNFLEKNYPNMKKIGLLGTLGTFETKIYENYFNKLNLFTVINPDIKGQNNCHTAIYDTNFGVKAKSDKITKRAKDIFKNEIKKLKKNGAEGIILGCTEIPLAFQGVQYFDGLLLIDPTNILARALIEYSDETRLKNLNDN